MFVIVRAVQAAKRMSLDSTLHGGASMWPHVCKSTAVTQVHRSPSALSLSRTAEGRGLNSVKTF
jgi:hypothetical protein